MNENTRRVTVKSACDEQLIDKGVLIYEMLDHRHEVSNVVETGVGYQLTLNTSYREPRRTVNCVGTQTLRFTPFKRFDNEYTLLERVRQLEAENAALHVENKALRDELAKYRTVL